MAIKKNLQSVSINHYVEQVLPLKARSRLWFLWTELQLKLAMSEMDLEGLWKHALQPLLLSVMCLLWCLLSFLLRWSLLCYTTCPLCFGFGTCSVCYIVAFVCSILFYILFFFTFTVLYIPMYFSPWFSNRFSQCYYIGPCEIKIKFNYLFFWFYYTFPYVSTTLTRFPFSACPVGRWVGGG